MTTEKQEAPLLAEVGESGLRRFGGYVDEEWQTDLSGRKAVAMWREMGDNHPGVSAVFYITKMISRQVEYRVDEKDEAEREAGTEGDPMYEVARQKIDEAFQDVEGGIRGAVGDALTMGQYGYALAEKVFKLRRGDHEDKRFRSKFNDGEWGWRAFKTRAQESILRWEFADDGSVLAAWQQPPTGGTKIIPMSKLLHFRLFTDKGNPEGRSLLRGAYTSYHYQKNMQFVEAVGVERNVAGIPDMQLPPEIMHPNASPEQKAIRAQYVKMVKNLRVDQQAGIVRPSEKIGDVETGYVLKLMSSSGKSFADTDLIIKRYRGEVLISLVAEHVVVGMDSVGSHSLHSDKTDMFALGVAGQIDAALDVLNEDAIPELLELNGIPAKYAPHVARGDLEGIDLGPYGTFVSQLVSAGVIVPDEKLEDHVRKMGHMPPSDRDDLTPRPVVQASLGQMEPQPMGQMPLPLPGDGPEVEKEEPEAPLSEFMDVDQAAELLNISRASIMRAINNGKLPVGNKVGSRHRIHRGALMNFMRGGQA